MFDLLKMESCTERNGAEATRNAGEMEDRLPVNVPVAGIFI